MEMRRHRWGRALIAASAVTLAAGGLAVAAMSMMAPPDGLDLSRSKPSANGAYVTSIVPGVDPVPVGTMHGWTVEVTTAAGKPVDGAALAIDGGMPQHGHGLPTKPRVTKELGQGRYRVEGMKFNMPGWWEIEVEIDGPAGRDEAVFNLVL